MKLIPLRPTNNNGNLSMPPAINAKGRGRGPFMPTVSAAVLCGTFDLFDIMCKQHHDSIELGFKRYKKERH